MIDQGIFEKEKTPPPHTFPPDGSKTFIEIEEDYSEIRPSSPEVLFV